MTEELFLDWLQNQREIAVTEVKIAWDSVRVARRRSNTPRIGLPIDDWVSDAKSITLRFADRAFEQAKLLQLPPYLGPGITLLILQFLEKWKLDLRSRVSSPLSLRDEWRFNAEPTIAKVQAEIAEFCKTAELKLNTAAIPAPNEPTSWRSPQKQVSDAELNQWFAVYKKTSGYNLTRDGIEQAGKKKFGNRVTLLRLRDLHKKSAPLGGWKRGRRPSNDK